MGEERREKDLWVRGMAEDDNGWGSEMNGKTTGERKGAF